MEIKYLPDLKHVGIWYTDFETGVTHWSAEMFRILGLKKERDTPSPELILKHIHIDDRYRVTDLVHEATHRQVFFSTQCLIVRADRVRIPAFVCGDFDRSIMKTIRYRYGVCVDLSHISDSDQDEVSAALMVWRLPPFMNLISEEAGKRGIELLEAIGMSGRPGHGTSKRSDE